MERITGFNGGTQAENVARSAIKVLEVKVLFLRAHFEPFGTITWFYSMFLEREILPDV